MRCQQVSSMGAICSDKNLDCFNSTLGELKACLTSQVKLLMMCLTH